MRTTVERILTNDSAKDAANIDDAPYEVRVTVYDDRAEWHESADVTVFVDRSTVSLLEMRQQALERTRDFFTKALDAISNRQ